MDLYMPLLKALLGFLFFRILDPIRGRLGINLGRLPMAVKLLYIRILVDRLSYPFLTGREPAPERQRTNRRQRRARYFSLPRAMRPRYAAFVVAAGLASLNLLGQPLLPPVPVVSGGATIVASRSGLFWRQSPGGLPIIQDGRVFAGNVFFVDVNTAQGGTTAGYGSHPDKALTTIDSAIDLCTASQGDAIFVLAGHTESIIAAAGINLDKIGVAVIGLGIGDNRPTITFATDVLADWEIDAASCGIYNFRFIGNLAAVAAAIDVDAAAFTMEDCDWFVATATTDIDITIITDAAANDITVRRCRFNYDYSRASTAVTAASTEVIRLVGADRARIEECSFAGNFSTAAINGVTTASGDIKILNNTIYNDATADVAGIIDLVAGCTGVIAYNSGFYGLHDDASALALIIDPASCAMIENYFSNVVTEAGGLVGTASS